MWGRFSYFLRLCLFALSRLRYLCLLIFLRRFLTTEPMQVILSCEIGVSKRETSVERAALEGSIG